MYKQGLFILPAILKTSGIVIIPPILYEPIPLNYTV